MLKNITLSADEALITQVRAWAAAQKKSLNDLFRMWLQQCVTQTRGAKDYGRLMKRLRHVRAGRAFSREERNARHD